MATRKKTTPEVEVKEPILAMTPAEMAAVLKGKFVQAATEVANDAHAESVVEQIIEDLNKQKRLVTLKLLGLEDKWGKWDVDHCNGRESPITNYLAQGAKQTIKQWVNEAVAEVLTTELKTKIMNDAKKAIHKEVQSLVHNGTNEYNLRKLAEPVIEGWLQQAADEVRHELGVEQRYVNDEE
jgi:hypothetical protein